MDGEWKAFSKRLNREMSEVSRPKLLLSQVSVSLSSYQFLKIEPHRLIPPCRARTSDFVWYIWNHITDSSQQFHRSVVLLFCCYARRSDNNEDIPMWTELSAINECRMCVLLSTRENVEKRDNRERNLKCELWMHSSYYNFNNHPGKAAQRSTTENENGTRRLAVNGSKCRVKSWNLSNFNLKTERDLIMQSERKLKQRQKQIMHTRIEED